MPRDKGLKLHMKERLINLRARIQSYRSGFFAYGWIVEIEPPKFTIDFIKMCSGCIGDKYHIEVVDGNELLMVDAVLSECNGDRGVFTALGDLRSAKANESMRLRVEIESTIRYRLREYPSTVKDLSCNGVGVATNAEIARGDNAEIELCIGATVLSLVGRCLYCRETGEERYRYRVGLFIPNLDQLIDPGEGNLRKKANRKFAS